ncbi:MAG: hypothetical protein LC658_15755, partial [Bacteroidales bacterium]|nr:hypothetical protein [Bacteroidales bacterium]
MAFYKMFAVFIHLFLTLLCGNFVSLAGETRQSDNPQKIPFGDPFIILHKDKYYAYGTNNPDGIEVYVSDDLHTWHGPVGTKNGLALHKEDVWADRWF